ncbi:MAG: cupin domain-containing protein [Bryobacterales bacterium]|nr:cupin domain-containing protein [Bryobacterales bacterium]
MKRIFPALLAAAALSLAADATYFDAAQVAAVLAKPGALAKQSDLTISGNHREKTGQAEVHDHETDIFYVTDGEATLVTGGKMTGSRNTRPGQYLGTGVEGGTAQRIKKGDVVLIPAGTPHWFKEVPKSVSYLVVKVIKQ